MSEYIVEPRELGSKNGKSVVVRLPPALLRECNFDCNTIFAVKSDRDAGTMIFRKVYEKGAEILGRES
jgi:hypothetical protein